MVYYVCASLCCRVWLWCTRPPAQHQPGGGRGGGPSLQLAVAGFSGVFLPHLWRNSRCSQLGLDCCSLHHVRKNIPHGRTGVFKLKIKGET